MLTANFATAVVFAAVVALICLSVRTLRKKGMCGHKGSCGGCSGSCSACSGDCGCPSVDEALAAARGELDREQRR